MRPELDAYGVELVTLSGEKPDAIRKGRKKHAAKAIMLSDADLTVTDRFNLRNPNTLTPKGVTGMPVPTTFLVDATGTIRWIDQSENYQVRSHPERVLAEIRKHIAAAPRAN